MKKVSQFLLVLFFVSAIWACKKTCGHCISSTGQKEASVCKNSSFSATGLDSYSQAEIACKNSGGTWQPE